jgi:hypothetical protein
MKLRNITFDESDKNLFQVDDVRLRADALKHSILPRLHILMKECIDTIRHVYDVDVLDDAMVMPALRWQVFQSDNWKCVSCGRGSQDDAIPHVDHIIPRSRGGKHTLDNYQTLCNVCNIGNSNKDDTDLRARTKIIKSGLYPTNPERERRA